MHRPFKSKAEIEREIRELQRERQQRELNELLRSSTKKRHKRGPTGPRLLSEQQIEDAQAHYDRLLDADQRKWKHQQTAAKDIAVNFLKLPEESFQTVEDQVVVPKLIERGLKRQRKK